MNKAAQSITVKVRDRVTFDTDEGIQAGYVNGLRRDVGNGELHAWVEVDHLLPGCFRAVPVADILTSDQVGPPSTFYIGVDLASYTAAANRSAFVDAPARKFVHAEHAFLTESPVQA